MEVVVNMKKILGILMMAFILTGCSSVTYNLDIYVDSFEEKLYFEYGRSDGLGNLDTLIQDNIKNIPSLKQENVEYDVTSSTVEIAHKFNDAMWISQSDIIKTLYNTVLVNKKGNVTTVRLKGYNNSRFVCGEFDEGCMLTLDKITFRLNSEYQILASNADMINVNKNQHIWEFDAHTKEEVYFSYSDKIRWDVVIRNFIQSHMTLLIVIGVLLGVAIVGLIAVGIFVYKNKKNNS